MAFIIGQASNYQDLVDKIHDIATGTSLQTISAIATAGSGYVVGDLLSVSGGTSTIGAVIEVTSVGGTGDITGTRVYNAGLYSVTPANNVSVTGGSGTNAEFTLTWNTNGWTAMRATNVGGSGQREVILRGSGGGTDQIFVGLQTYVESGATNVELRGFTGYSSGLTWLQQPNISTPCYVPAQATAIDFWLSVKPRRIIGVAKTGSGNYSSFYLGFLNPYATPSQWAYPLYIAGSTSDSDVLSTSSSIEYSSIVDPIAHTNSDGPACIRTAAGSWEEVYSSYLVSATRSANTDDTLMYPSGVITSDVTGGDIWYTSGTTTLSNAIEWPLFIPDTAIPGSTSSRFYPTVGATPKYIRLPATIVSGSPSRTIHGEIDGCFWFNTNDIVQAENRLQDGNDFYRVFASGSRTERWAHWCLLEE